MYSEIGSGPDAMFNCKFGCMCDANVKLATSLKSQGNVELGVWLPIQIHGLVDLYEAYMETSPQLGLDLEGSHIVEKLFEFGVSDWLGVVAIG